MGNDCSVPPYAKVLAGDYRVRPGFATRRRRGTGDWQLIFTLSGAGRFRFADGGLVTRPGDTILLRPGTPQDYTVDESARRWRFLWFHFLPRAGWEPWMRAWPLVAPGTHHLRLRAVADHPAGQGERTVGRQLRRAHRYATEHSRRGDDRAFNALEAALLHLDELNPLAIADPEPRRDARVEAAVVEMRRHLARPFSLAALARRHGLSPSRLAHLFRADMGVAPGRYLEAARLERARRLLGSTRRGVQEIAVEVGFDDQAYFSRRFKRATGYSPRTFRAALWAEKRGAVAVAGSFAAASPAPG